MPATESYPDDLRYHPEHDWARVDDDEATLGITWFAQDALGELVHFEPPQVGGTVTQGQPCGEVESVKAVSDVVSPLSGEVLEVNQKAIDYFSQNGIRLRPSNKSRKRERKAAD